eukprot:TRINITY_DN7756_c0_g3_i1.p1 TRINITY_DN7756_c0_g3~~TRINITY_DN7756_c0_g3_i1.p1  ORF type:complete len:131 (+),score=14.03 TRINITY_DN7756_c0_g3_i1:647-1039(+)
MIAQINQVIKLASTTSSAQLAINHNRGDKMSEMEWNVVNYVNSKSNLIEGEGCHNGFYAFGKIKKSNEIIVANDFGDYCWDTKRYNRVAELRRELLKQAKQPYCELNYPQFCEEGKFNPKLLFKYLDEHT